MKTARILTIMVVVLGLMPCLSKVNAVKPMGTAFTYQGRLIDANNAADGLYDFQFKLFDANVAGNQLGTDVNKPEVDVIDGYFTVELDFGGAFDGNDRWLEISIRPGDSNDPNAYTTLIPRQEITPTPYALQTRGIFVDSAGNVGIGTTNPAAKLDVNGGINTLSLNLNGTPVSPAADAYTKLLIHADGTDGSTSFIDTSAAGNQITANGNVQISNTQSKFGGASGLFDGTGDYLSLDDSDDWYFGSGDFTIDCWVRTGGTGAQIAHCGNPYNVNGAWQFGGQAALFSFLFNKGGGPENIIEFWFSREDAPGGVRPDEWTHIAVVRSGSTLLGFVNGSLRRSIEITCSLGFSNKELHIGDTEYAGLHYYHDGWIDEFRISKSIARWTANFTPPTRPYADSSSAFAIGSTGKAYYFGNVGIGTTNPAYKLDVEGDVQAYAYHTGDIFFQKDGQKLWRMFEDEDGVYLENLKTGKIYSFVLKEAEGSNNVNLEQTMRDLRSENEFLKERIENLERTMQRILLAEAKEVQQ